MKFSLNCDKASRPILVEILVSCTLKYSAGSGIPSDIIGIRRSDSETPSGIEEYPGVITSSVARDALEIR